MTRPGRVDFDGAFHHVTNRGAGRRAIFRERADREMFLTLLGQAAETYGLKVFAYVLLDTEYHLLVQTSSVPLAEPMRAIAGPYTQSFNKAHDGDGPLFRGRYKAQILEPGGHVLMVSRYMHRSPLDLGLTQSPESYEWSSLARITGRLPARPWLARKELLCFLGDGADGARYLSFVLGTEAEADLVLGEIGEADTARRLKEVPPPPLPAIIEAVARRMSCSALDVQRGRRGDTKVSEARLMAMWIARRRFGYDLETLREAFGFGTVGAVSATLARFKSRVSAKGYLKREIDHIAGQLQP